VSRLHDTHARGVLKLTGGLLEAQVEGLLLELYQLITELIRRLLTKFAGRSSPGSFQHHGDAPGDRVTLIPVEFGE
jgi:hypothetical protein